MAIYTTECKHLKRATFPRSARLLKPIDFQHIGKKAKRYTDRFFTILTRINQDKSARLGLAIAKRCAKGAVMRNRLKRIIRESFRQQRLDLEGFDFLVMCRPQALQANNAELSAALEKHWRNIIRLRQCAH